MLIYNCQKGIGYLKGDRKMNCKYIVEDYYKFNRTVLRKDKDIFFFYNL